ncbi:MAG: response regulator [Verrucomicrobiota bacterium]
MKPQLNILLLEDSALDASLIEEELLNKGFNFSLKLIQSENELRQELDAKVPDLILSDHGLPSFDGFTALKIVRDHHPQLPFIFVSGSNNQAMVSHMHEEGATDYVFKNDIHDLAPAIRLALETPVEPETHLKQPVPEIPIDPPPQLVTTKDKGRLFFCPKCLQVFDEQNCAVHMDKYLGDHAKITVVREVCADCSKPSSL